jgi:hypothetical protein
MRAALSVHAERGSVAVLDAAPSRRPRPRRPPRRWRNGARSARPGRPRRRGDRRAEELPQHRRVQVAEVGAIGVADVIGAASLVVSETALEKLEERLG